MFWNFAEVERKLIPVGRVDAHRQPHRCAIVIKRDPADLDHRHPAIVRQLEECGSRS